MSSQIPYGRFCKSEINNVCVLQNFPLAIFFESHTRDGLTAACSKFRVSFLVNWFTSFTRSPRYSNGDKLEEINRTIKLYFVEKFSLAFERRSLRITVHTGAWLSDNANFYRLFSFICLAESYLPSYLNFLQRQKFVVIYYIKILNHIFDFIIFNTLSKNITLNFFI